MDPIETISWKKDTSFRLLLEAQARGFELYYMTQRDLSLRYGAAWGHMSSLAVFDEENYYRLGASSSQPLDQLNIILMRVDPPLSLEYFYLTYILEHAEQNGVLVVNSPQGLRDANEKLFTTQFPQCLPPSLTSCSVNLIKGFVLEQEATVVKPLDAMGGREVFYCTPDDPNLNSILESLTHHGKRTVMAQRFIPEIQQGDKRILLLDGYPLPYALSRIPAPGEFRANLMAGAKGTGARLTERDEWICEQLGPSLRAKGLLFVGIDVIGDYLTEINVTSPTGLREIESLFEQNLSSDILDCFIEKIEE